MRNLSQGVVESEERKIILNMLKDNLTVEQIARISQKTVEEVEAIIEKEKEKSALV